eukprot:jgi/Mesvir1/26944/Mv20665-RA.1
MASLSTASCVSAPSVGLRRANPAQQLRLSASQPAVRLHSRRVQVTRMGLDPKGPSICITGVTGAVGQEFLRVLDERNFPYSNLKVTASERSKGQKINFQGREYTVEVADQNTFKDVDIALFSAGGSLSKELAPLARDVGCIVIDNSSAFRMIDGIPLTIPEVNPESIKGIKVGTRKGAIIANPNCSTIIALTAINVLYREAGIKRMVVSTYQAASGAGYSAMLELQNQTREVLDGKPPTMKIFPQQYAFNLFSHNTKIGPEGYNEEELKMLKESRKIWNDPEIRVAATCVRVPVMRAHAESINLSFRKPLSETRARELLLKAPGVDVVDDRENNRFPTPLLVSNKDNVAVGRIRSDISQDKDMGLELFVCGDQIKKGAALNACVAGELIRDMPAAAIVRFCMEQLKNSQSGYDRRGIPTTPNNNNCAQRHYMRKSVAFRNNMQLTQSDRPDDVLPRQGWRHKHKKKLDVLGKREAMGAANGWHDGIVP